MSGMKIQARPIIYIGGGPPQAHKYLSKLLQFAPDLAELPGRVGHILVSHDDWCAFFKGRACNCDPDVREMLPWEIVGS